MCILAHGSSDLTRAPSATAPVVARYFQPVDLHQLDVHAAPDHCGGSLQAAERDVVFRIERRSTWVRLVFSSVAILFLVPTGTAKYGNPN